MKKLYLISCGTGDPEEITLKAFKILTKCDLLLGSHRLVKAFAFTKRPSAEIDADASDVGELINSRNEEIIGVLLSGDAGFYSLATRLRGYISDREVVTVAGVGVVQSAAAILNVPWQSLSFASMHTGRETITRLAPNGMIILMKEGINLKNLFSDFGDILSKFEISVLVSIGLRDQQVFVWDGEDYITPQLCTLAVLPL